MNKSTINSWVCAGQKTLNCAFFHIDLKVSMFFLMIFLKFCMFFLMIFFEILHVFFNDIFEILHDGDPNARPRRCCEYWQFDKNDVFIITGILICNRFLWTGFMVEVSCFEFKKTLRYVNGPPWYSGYVIYVKKLRTCIK